MGTNTLISMGIFGASAGLIAYAVRMHIATMRTKKDMHGMLDLCIKHKKVLEFYDDFNISFFEHHNQYMWFRNPWRLYSVKFIDFLRFHNFIDLVQANDARKHAYAREKKALDIAQMAISNAEASANNTCSGRGTDT